MSNFQNQELGWIFKRVVALDIHVDKYNPIGATSYIDLPSELKMKIETIVNSKNEDNQCFKWLATAAVYPATKDQQRFTTLEICL